jgi:putative oxidoreductase
MEGTFARHWAIPLRVAAGITFMIHGAPKLFSAEGHAHFQGFLGKLGFPLPALMSWVSGIAEFFGGIALLLGILTWIASLILVFEMLVAILVVHLPSGFLASHGELPLVLIAGLLALLIGGPGPLSIDERAAAPGSRLRAPWWRDRHAHA